MSGIGLGVDNNDSLIQCCLSTSFCGRKKRCGMGGRGKCSPGLGCGHCSFHDGMSIGVAGAALLRVGLSTVVASSHCPNVTSGGL